MRKPTGILSRQQLIHSRCVIPWAEEVYAVLNNVSGGTKRIDLVYRVGKTLTARQPFCGNNNNGLRCGASSATPA